MSNRQPIGNTCPEIDKYIRSIKSAMESGLNTLEYDDLLNTAEIMNDELDNCIDYLESLRSSNDTLRSWGQGEADEVDYLKNTINELEKKIEELENQLKATL